MTTVLDSYLRQSLFSGLTKICNLAGLSPDGAFLIRYTMNAVWALERPGLIVRMTADDHQAGNTPSDVVRIASLLGRAGAPIAEAADELQQPLKIDGWTATFWRLLRPLPTEESSAATAIVGPLRALHDVVIDQQELQRWDIAAKIEGRLDAVKATRGRHRDNLERWAIQSVGMSLGALTLELQGRLARTRSDLKTARWRLTPGVIHGDAHSGNLVMTAHGDTVWCDLDSVAFGPREWDLVPAAFGMLRFGRDPSSYARFAAAFGFDVMADDMWPVLRDLRDLQAVTSVLAALPGRPQLADEVASRLRGLLSGEPVTWQRFT